MSYHSSQSTQQLSSLANILSGIFLHYLLYIGKHTKSYAVMTSSATIDIERRIAYMIKTNLKKIIDSNPTIGSAVSNISMRYAQITVSLNHFGGSMWSNTNTTVYRYIKGFIAYSCREKYFPGVEESNWPVRIENNNGGFTFIMKRDLFKSDAEIANGRVSHDDVVTTEVITPLKTKIRSLCAAIVTIPTMFEDIINYRESLRSRMFDSNFVLRDTFRNSLFDMFLGFIASGTSSYILRNENRYPELRDVTYLINNLIDAHLPDTFYTESIYMPDGKFILDVTAVCDNGRGAYTQELVNRFNEVKVWLMDLCDQNNVIYENVAPVFTQPVTQTVQNFGAGTVTFGDTTIATENTTLTITRPEPPVPPEPARTLLTESPETLEAIRAAIRALNL